MPFQENDLPQIGIVIEKIEKQKEIDKEVLKKLKEIYGKIDHFIAFDNLDLEFIEWAKKTFYILPYYFFNSLSSTFFESLNVTNKDFIKVKDLVLNQNFLENFLTNHENEKKLFELLKNEKEVTTYSRLKKYSQKLVGAELKKSILNLNRWGLINILKEKSYEDYLNFVLYNENIFSSNKNSEAKIKAVYKTARDKRFLYYKKFIEEKLEKNDNALMIFPEITILEMYYELLKESFKETLLCKVYKTATDKSWTFLSQQRGGKIFLSLPEYLFFPFKNLGLIIVENAESPYYDIQDIPYKPNFNLNMAAYKKASLFNIDLIYSCSMPDGFLYNEIAKKKIEGISLNHDNSKGDLINLKQEKLDRNFSTISRKLKTKINEALSKKETPLLILNLKGYSSMLFCSECGFIPHCKVCGNILSYDIENKTLFCKNCGYIEKSFDNCPNCSGFQIKRFGFGLQKLKKDLLFYFKGIKVLEIDQDNPITPYNHENTIIIGTNYLLKFDLKKFYPVSLISSDIILNKPLFFSFEETFINISMLLIESRHTIIQSQKLDEDPVRFAFSLDEKSFYKKEFYLRKSLKFPPYNFFVTLKLFYKGKDAAKKSLYLLKEKFEEMSKNKKDAIFNFNEKINYVKKGEEIFFEVFIKTKDSSMFYNDILAIIINSKRLYNLSNYEIKVY